MLYRFEIVPYERVGSVYFGYTREQVFEKLGQPTESFFRGRDTQPTDIYREIGLMVSYSEDNGIVDFIECVEPAEPIFQGINLFDPNYKKTIKKLQNSGYIMQQDKVGCESYDLGVGFYMPIDKLEAVCFFRKGYYDEYNAKNGLQKQK